MNSITSIVIPQPIESISTQSPLCLPVQDGNGRLSRILTTLMLLKAGYSYVPYSSLERVIEQLPPLSQEIVRIAAQHGKVVVRDAERITGANRNTIKAHISELVRRGRLKMAGKGKGTWYKLP